MHYNKLHQTNDKHLVMGDQGMPSILCITWYFASTITDALMPRTSFKD
jgi:hypothetical protein